MTTQTKNVADTREDIRTAIFSLAYQAVAKEQWSDGDSPLTATQIERVISSLLSAYRRLTSVEDADDVECMAWREARQGIHGE